MTLATHAIAGAAIASFTPQNPALGFCAGFATHFVLDAIPHYDYKLHSASINPKIGAPLRINAATLRDISAISVDAAVGIAVSLFFFATPLSYIAILAGALGGILPDALQFLWGQWRNRWLGALQYFHVNVMHTRHRLRETGQFLLGIISQVGFIILVIAATLYLHTLAL